MGLIALKLTWDVLYGGVTGFKGSLCSVCQRCRLVDNPQLPSLPSVPPFASDCRARQQHLRSRGNLRGQVGEIIIVRHLLHVYCAGPAVAERLVVHQRQRVRVSPPLTRSFGRTS